MKLRLSYSDGISVVPLDMTVEQLRREPVWKIRLSALRRYAPSYREADVLFSWGLTIQAPSALLSCCSRRQTLAWTAKLTPTCCEALRRARTICVRRRAWAC